MTKLAHLPRRIVLAVSGADRVSFLNGLVSNDVALATPGQAVWAALLTPQGKYLADFFIFAEAERLLLDCEAVLAPDIAKRLLRFKLRADVEVAPVAMEVYAAWDGVAPVAAHVAADPRVSGAGWRLLSGTPLEVNAPFEAWDAHRIALGLPDGTRDLEPDKTLLLEAGFDELHGISWTKGCYMGQELTARTRYRGLVKRRLVPVTASLKVPPPETKVTAGGREVGTIRSGQGAAALAVVRVDALGESLTSADVPLRVALPSWWRLATGAEA